MSAATAAVAMVAYTAVTSSLPQRGLASKLIPCVSVVSLLIRMSVENGFGSQGKHFVQPSPFHLHSLCLHGFHLQR